MKRTFITVLTIFALALLLASCGAMNKNRAGKGSGGMEQEWVSEGEIGSERVNGQSGHGSSYTMEADSESHGSFRDILFDYDKYDIREDARPILDSAASSLNENREQHIVIEGYTDERGTNEYNLALGEKRAKATMKYLRSLGVSPQRMMIMTFGEERPLCTAQNETCWQRNRRALIK